LRKVDLISQLGVIEATVHKPVYTMHKFWARRPWSVFRRIIEVFTRPGQIILDPFAGGGVTLVEGLIMKRRVVAVDLNPLACFIMETEVRPLDLRKFEAAIEALRPKLEPVAVQLYGTSCPRCGSVAMAEWIERRASSDKALSAYVHCSCGFTGETASGIGVFDEPPRLRPLAYPTQRIPPGEKTRDLIRRGYTHFHQLFTQRNIVMLSYLKSEVEAVADEEARTFLRLAFSSTLKWASKMSHRRGKVVEGWAMHAYWIYPRYLEINVWTQFLRRAGALVRGKRYSNSVIGAYARPARSFNELSRGDATYMIICGDSRRLPIPDSTVDAVVTDPPYGGNVNYAELSDYFLVWQSLYAPKEEEIVINPVRGIDLERYREGLREVFSECYRVLRPGAYLVSTFNSTDPMVVAAFVYSLRAAGFSFAGISYQPYLKAYETTFHAMQIDAVPFDFVFCFRKGAHRWRGSASMEDLKALLTRTLEWCLRSGQPLRDYLARTYPALIEYMAHAPLEKVLEAAELQRKIIDEHFEEFSRIRRKIARERIRNYERRRRGLGS